jgi:uridylate kinase
MMLVAMADEKETIGFRFKQSKSAADLPIPFHGDVADAIGIIAQMGNAAILAFLLKMVLKDRITDDEIQLICDVYYHDEA